MIFAHATGRLCTKQGDRQAVNSDRLAASQEWRSYRWLVVRNPLYWLCWLPTLLLIVAWRARERAGCLAS